MRWVTHTMVMIGLFLASLLSAQESDYRINGNFRDIPFSEFASSIQKQSGLRFFYKDRWVRGIRINASGRDLSLEHILNQALGPAGIYHYWDEFGNIYLTDGLSLKPELPDYSASGDTLEHKETYMESRSPTRLEKRTLEGHRNGQLETLFVGDVRESGSTVEAVIQGRILDAETGEPLIGATVYEETLRKGAATDLEGRFTLILERGKHTVTFKCMGMATRQNILQVYSDGNLTIQMEKGLIPISEVVVKADRYDHIRGSQMGFERLNYRTTKEVPVVMGEKDLLKVAQMLPGVQSVGEGSAGFNVRGGSADQNLIYVNQVPVYNSSHLFGFFTSFSPDVVKNFSMYKSNLPASFGGRLSSIFDVSTRQGNLKSYTARGGISPITGHMAVEGPIVRDKSAFVFSARSTYSDWILGRLEDPELRESDASFYDLSGTLTMIPNENNLIRAFGYFSSDKFSLSTTNRYAYSNAGASLSIKHRFGTRMSGDMALVFGQYAFSTQNTEHESQSYSHDYQIGHYELKADFTWVSLGKHRVTYGLSGIYYDLNRGIVEPYGENSLRYPVDLGNETGVELAVYLSDEISLSPKFTANLGFRHSIFLTEAVSYQGPEPRVSLTYLLGRLNSLKASYNRLNQYILMLSSTFAISPTDQWKLADKHLRPPFVNQYSLGYYRDLPDAGIQASTEFYYKNYKDVLEYRDGADFISSPDIENQVAQGEQQAWGAELMIRKNSGKLNGWLSYTYSRSMMLFNSSIPGESINEGLSYSSNYDRPHNLNLVTNYRLNRRLSMSTTLVYITGRPITYPVSIYYRDGIQYLEYSNRNQYRIPDYFRIDFSINLEGNLKRRKLAHSFWMFSVYNLTGRNNPYSVYFQNENGEIKGHKLSIFGQPVVTLSWNFKFGNYASE